MKHEINTGGNLNGINAYELNNQYHLTPEIFVLRVAGGNIYYRDVLVTDRDNNVVKMTQTSTFVPDSK